MVNSGTASHRKPRTSELHKWRDVARGALGLVVTSAVAGAIVTAGLTSVAAVTGAGVQEPVAAFNDISDIEIGQAVQRNEIFANRDGEPVKIADVYDQNREELAWDEVSPHLKDAAVAAEDRRFYEHGAVDPRSLARAAFGFLTNTGDSGGSTIAIQLVKNLRVNASQQLRTEEARDAAYEDAIRNSPGRKIHEIKLAVGLEKRYSKDEILLAYLNVAGFARATYGVQAAAERYYSSSATDLTPAQAASLVAIVQNPDALNLGTPENYPKNKLRRDLILGNMLELGHVDQQQHDEALATPVESYVKLQDPTNGCLYATDAKFFCDFVVHNVPQLEALGANAEERTANWKRGGYQIHTSLDLDQQDVAQTQVDTKAPADETRFALGAAAVTVQPGTGRILVMAQNKGFNNTPEATPAETAINFSTDIDFGGSAGFQAASTYKIFTLARWLQTGHTLRESVNGSERIIPASSFTCDGVPVSGDAFDVGNDTSGLGGQQSVLSATARSVNGAYASMAEQLDLCEIRDVAESMGVHRADGAPLQTVPSSILGTNQVAPLTMAAAIATVAANGTYCAPTAIDRIIDAEGKDVGDQAEQCSPALEPNVAATVAFGLTGAFQGDGTAVGANPGDRVPIFGKTGTTDDAFQNWMIGATTKIATAVWVGNITGDPAKADEKNQSGEQSLRRISVAGTNGANIKSAIFKSVLQSFNKDPDYRGEEFPDPDPLLVRGKVTEPPAPTAKPEPPEGEATPAPTKSPAPGPVDPPRPMPTPPAPVLPTPGEPGGPAKPQEEG